MRFRYQLSPICFFQSVWGPAGANEPGWPETWMKGLRWRLTESEVGGGDKAEFEHAILGRTKKAAGAVSSRAFIARTWTRSIFPSRSVDLDLNLNQEDDPLLDAFFLALEALDLIHWRRSELILASALGSGAAWVIKDTKIMLERTGERWIWEHCYTWWVTVVLNQNSAAIIAR